MRARTYRSFFSLFIFYVFCLILSCECFMFNDVFSSISFPLVLSLISCLFSSVSSMDTLFLSFVCISFSPHNLWTFFRHDTHSFVNRDFYSLVLDTLVCICKFYSFEFAWNEKLKHFSTTHYLVGPGRVTFSETKQTSRLG